MKKVGVSVFFDHRENHIHGNLNIPEISGLLTVTNFYFDESTTYEEMVRMLIQEGRLLPLDDRRLRYNFVLQAFESYFGTRPHHLRRSLSKPVTLREGQTLESTDLTRLVMDESEFQKHIQIHGYSKPSTGLYCATSVEIRDSPQPKSPSSTTSPKWGDVISSIGDLFVTTATAMSIIGGLDVIERRWKEWRLHHAPSLQGASQTSETDIVAIRLRMTHGPDHAFVEWLTDPDRLKHYIDAFSQPSSSIKPLQAIFVQRNDKALLVDVLEGVQNNLPLNELLSYLNIS